MRVLENVNGAAIAQPEDVEALRSLVMMLQYAERECERFSGPAAFHIAAAVAKLSHVGQLDDANLPGKLNS